MGCNAWNHAWDCDCGWGGDTGGGGGWRHADGLRWRGTSVSHDCYVNPNARCPVCGADVFFYQSPYGGRVFFDELGPPWPKHPCTDLGNSWGWQGAIQAARGAKTLRSICRINNPKNWSPFLPINVEHSNQYDLHHVDLTAFGTPGSLFLLPSKTFRDVPLYWRQDPENPAFIEVSTISSNLSSLGEETRHSCPSWTSSSGDIDAYIRGEPLSGKVLNSIGWWLSFHWKDPDNPNWPDSECIDWHVAREYFLKGAELGFWAAYNNLGVIYQEGLGVEPNPSMAFSYFEQAAQQLDPIPLRHLADCYRSGNGVFSDIEKAQFLEELADLQDQERPA